MSEENKEFHTITQTWSDNLEKVIKNIGESCEGYKWMHIFAAKRASIKYNYFMYTLIFLGPIAGILSTITVEDDSKVLRIMVIIMSFVSGVLSAITKYSKFEQKASSYKSIAAKYASLEGNIRRQLALYRNERVNAGDYLEWVSKSYDDLFSSAPLMSQEIYQKWIEYAKKNGISVAAEYGKTIEIQTEHASGIKHNSVDTNLGHQKHDSGDKNNIEILVSSKAVALKKCEPELSDLNRFTDTAMQYEMKRLKNHQ